MYQFCASFITDFRPDRNVYGPGLDSVQAKVASDAGFTPWGVEGIRNVVRSEIDSSLQGVIAAGWLDGYEIFRQESNAWDDLSVSVATITRRYLLVTHCVNSALNADSARCVFKGMDPSKL